jgi:hypothetical protein
MVYLGSTKNGKGSFILLWLKKGFVTACKYLQEWKVVEIQGINKDE